MLTRKATALLFAALIAAAPSCRKAPGGGHSVESMAVSIAGSTSVMPFTEKLAEMFMIQNPSHVINVQAGGSSAGIQACLTGTVTIGMSSRELNAAEKTLKEIVICWDGIVVVVNSENPVRSLSIEQVRDIYSGKTTNWKELGWIDRGIDAVTREEGSGTRGAFEELVMKKVEISDAIMVQDSNGSVKEVVASDPYAIGFLSLGMIDNRVAPVKIDGVDPTVENIKKKTYRIVRPFLYLMNGEPPPAAKFFIDYVLSKQGQEILKKEGLIPANE
ncbi:MAG: phosphate ABC transporter substrate-binding protein [Spirochaetes bacterium]|nr:phosphate ABC transporter substrate-binding protein [Spirochaetota bacterium]